jgi:hypothetical protein
MPIMTYDQNPEPSNDDESSVPALTASSRNVARNQLVKVRSQVSGGLPPNLYRREGFTSPPPAGAILNDKAFINTPFSVLPLYLPTLWNPVPGHDGGLNAAALIVNQFGVICIVNAYLDQKEHDFISLRVNGTQVTFHIVTDDEASKGKAIVLFINSSRFFDQANNTIQAFVTPEGGDPVPSKLFNIFVDRQLPVSPFPTFNKPYNENMAVLKFTDPLIEAFGLVTLAQMQLGTEVEIANYPLDRSLPQVHWRKEHDVITVSIGGATASHTVTAFEAASNDPIKFTLYFGFWSQVPDGVRLAEWNVLDKVGNPSPGASPPRLIQVDSGASTEPLLKALLASESDYDPVRDLDFIDTRHLVVDTPLELLIRNQGYLLDDTVIITVRGLAADGTSSEKIIDYTVNSITPIRVYIPLDLDFLLLLSGGLILITYKRVRPGVADRPSEGVLYAIDGEPVEDGLKAPIVLDLNEGALPADTNPVRIVVPRYFGQLPNDRVDLIVTGLTADGRPVYATFTDMAGTGDLTFLLDNPFFAALNGGYFVAYYEINGAAQRPASKSVTVPVGDAQAVLPPPWTLQATPPDHTFDPAISLANLNVRVDPHPVIVEGAQIRLFAIGTQPGGSFTSNWFNVDDNWEGSVVPFTVPRLIVLANLNSTMRLYYEVIPAPGAANLFSRDLVINVGMALRLPTPPKVLEATVISPTEAEMNPLHVRPPSPTIVTIQVPATDLLPTDDVTVHIVGMPGLGEPVIPSKPGVPDAGVDYISFPILSDFVAAYLGSFCQVFFTVMRNGNPVPSAILTLRVTALPSSTLDIVSVPEANGTSINVNTANNVKIDPWPFFKAGQPVFIELEHTAGDLTLRDGLVVTPSEFTAGRTLDLIPGDYLKTKPNGSSLTVRAKVVLNGTGLESGAIALTPRTYTLSSVPPLTIPGDTRFVNLGGWLLKNFGITELAYGLTTRTASGGKGPYRYSSNSSAVIVEASSGRVTPNGTGTATITVTDSSQPPQSATYQIQVSGSYSTLTYIGILPWANANASGRLPTISEFSSLYWRFSSAFPLSGYYWTVHPTAGQPNVYHIVEVVSGSGLSWDAWSSGNNQSVVIS